MNVFVSDLFFNMDLSGCYNEETGYETERLQEEAEWLLSALKDLGVSHDILPTPQKLVENFLERI